MPLETVRDNQWWYSQSVHRSRVENCGFVMLSIGGRECPLIHSDLGCDGRPTHSFKFVDPDDRAFWIALRGKEIDIEVVECRDQMQELDHADETDQVDESGAPSKLKGLLFADIRRRFSMLTYSSIGALRRDLIQGRTAFGSAQVNMMQMNFWSSIGQPIRAHAGKPRQKCADWRLSRLSCIDVC